MSRRVIESADAPSAVGPYSQAVACDGWIYVSGQLPATSDGTLITADLAEATRQCLRNIRAILRSAGADLDAVVKATVYLTDLGAFDTMNTAYREFFQERPPARACIEVGALPKGVPVEIEAVAWIPDRDG
jgi:2-iminobutanoate/2-iminopropanoate deaminase